MTFDLRLGNCIDLAEQLEDNSINCTVTSPPYNKKKVGSTKAALEKKYIPGVSTNGVFRKIEYDNFSDTITEEEYQEQQIELLNVLFDKTVKGGSLFYNHKVRYMDGGSISPWQWLTKTKWHIREEIIWARGGATEISGYRFLHSDERIYWLVNGNKHPKLPRECANYGSVWKFGPETKNDHPAPYPLILPIRCIQSVLQEPGVVLDPYNGSGTTGVAATLLGHEYIGFDLSEKYLKQSEERISNPTKRDMDKFRENVISAKGTANALESFLNN